ncbi:hypothetical protein [Streptomyces sp. NBC_01190]|uniref:hypothetical protein n=1 Tax=Streptomyces sp. NBC_01190 TaxID=2903767 RepID=UPI003866E827|nr:hypothetical protein OG519_00065 [Streptomyces sp. NBC_01190]WSS24139.1 hypothetical protein OG519_33985 [Streptomyces sp. NBC_01190]
MLAFTLDTNCLIALEEDRLDTAPGVRALLARHHAGELVVRIVATTAAERQLDGTYLPNFGAFLSRLAAVGLDHLPILKPPAAFDLTYSDWCVFAGDDDEEEGRRIHQALFVSPYDYGEAVPSDLQGEDRSRAEHKWRNRRLDGLGLQTHIHARADVFVTSDKAFFKDRTRQALSALGAGTILTPAQAGRYQDQNR